MHTHAKLFFALNTNTSLIDDDIKLLKDFLRQPAKITGKSEDESGDQKLLNLKKYVHNVLNVKLKASESDFIDYNDDNMNNEDTKFKFLNSIFRFHNNGMNKNTEFLFSENNRFILLLTAIIIIIFLFIIVSVSVVVCYRRQKFLLTKKAIMTLKKNNGNNCSPEKTKVNINDNLLSSLIDVASQSSSEPVKKINNSTSPSTFQKEIVPTSETLKRFNKLRPNINDYELNISAEDQTALLLYSNSPSSTSSSTTSNRQIQNSSNASASSNQTSQTNISKKVLNNISSIDHVDEIQKYSTLRTFKNLPVVGTPSKLLEEKEKANGVYNQSINKYEQTSTPMSTFSSESYQPKYYTLPNNRLSLTANLINTEETTTNGTLKLKFSPKESFLRNENCNNDIYSKTLNQMKGKNGKDESSKELINHNNFDFEILNRNRFQTLTFSQNNNKKINSEIPEYFFKNKKELKKLVQKNNIIDCKRLELADETD